MLKNPTMSADTAAEFRRLAQTAVREVTRFPHHFSMATNAMYRIHHMARGVVNIEPGKGLGLSPSDRIYVLEPDISARPEQLAPIINALINLPFDCVEVHLHSVPNHPPLKTNLPVRPDDLRRFTKESLDRLRTQEPPAPVAPAA